MPPDIPGIGAVSRLLPSPSIGSIVPPGLAALGPVGPVTPSTAVAPVAPASPRAPSAPSSPLGRSGLDLLDIFGTTDLLVERGAVAPVALDVGLETARGALLRGLAAESLATLDGVWESAQRTEEGWYLRSGALTVLGLPGEAERVSTEALALKPSSVALRFIQSLARLASGDIAGARAAIATAAEQQPADAVLLMQQVIVFARQGNRGEAERLLQQGMRLFPDHPAVDFARASLRSIAADQTRQSSRGAVSGEHGAQARDDFGPTGGGRMSGPAPFTTGDHEVFAMFGAAPRNAVDRAHAGAAETSAVETDPSTPAAAGDALGNVAERALARLGARLATISATDAVREGRMLIRAFSAGGSMAGACAPEQAHAARGVLAAILFALNSGSGASRAADGASPIEALIAQWLPLMQTERYDDASRVLRRFDASIPEAQRRLLAACTQRPMDAAARAGRESPMVSFGTGEYEAIVRGEPARGPLIPVRLGLALLEERAVDRPTGSVVSGWEERSLALVPSGLVPYVGTPRGVTPLPGAVGSLEADLRGWGAAMTVSAYQPRPRDEVAGMRIAALLCVVIAAGAATSGSNAVAVAFGIGAAWLALRQSGRSGTQRDGTGNRDTTDAD